MKNHNTARTRETLRQDVNTLKRSAVQVAQDVRDHATAHVDETKQRVTDTIGTVRENLTTHPFSLVAVGFVLGLVVGFRLRRQG